jgi:phytoene dehydrogenase-like protein
MAAFLRPANRSPVPGLFLVGGSAHPGGGLPLVMMSAKIVADMIGDADGGQSLRSE